jgi:hypothetical protein
MDCRVVKPVPKIVIFINGPIDPPGGLILLITGELVELFGLVITGVFPEPPPEPFTGLVNTLLVQLLFETEMLKLVWVVYGILTVILVSFTMVNTVII